jgi:hypothetical protein
MSLDNVKLSSVVMEIQNIYLKLQTKFLRTVEMNFALLEASDHIKYIITVLVGKLKVFTQRQIYLLCPSYRHKVFSILSSF